MELSINISRQGSSQRDEKFRKWEAESFPPDLHVPSDKPKKMMDEKLYTYAKEDRFDELFRELHRVSSTELSSIIYRQVGPSGNSLLHVAASHGSKDVTELLLHHFPLLITRKNFQEDTALHLAARGGQPQTTFILVNKAKGHGGETNFVTFMKVQDDRGNTALHYAVINRHLDVASFLVSEVPKLSYMENNEHKSPLYLAVENSNEEQSDDNMLTILMHAIPDEVDLLKMLEGKSPVHAAVQGRKKNIMVQIANKKPELLRRKDEKEANALHCAAYMGYVSGTRYLFDEYRDGAIEQNGEGNLPIHVASQKGHVDVVDVYISKWTDPTEFLNSKRQSILHVAAESGQLGMVKYILKNNKLQALVNEKDRDGNTPLHLASKYGRSIATFTLVRNKMAMKEIANGENLTPYQVVEKQSKILEAEFSCEPIPNGKDNQVDLKSDYNAGMKQAKSKPDNHEVDNQVDEKNDRDGGKQQPKSKLDYHGVMMTLSILHYFAGPKRSEVEYFFIQGTPLSKEEMKSRIEALLVVAVLVAGVTFAGAIQLPQDGSKYKICLLAYMYCDMVALCSSTLAAMMLCSVQLDEIKSPSVVWFASGSVGLSIYFMFLAFFFAFAIAARENHLFLVTMVVVAASHFIILTLFVIRWFFPPAVNQVVQRFFSINMYLIMFAIHYGCAMLSRGS